VALSANRLSAVEFAAPRWLENAHVQTVGAALPFFFAEPSRTARSGEERLVFPVGEGGALVGRAWWLGAAGAASTVLLVHGIGGGVESRYMVRAAVALHRAGFHVVRVNLRGAGEGLAEARSLYHAGLSSDLDAVVRALGRDARVRDLVVLGFSGGGSLALKLAGEWGGAPPTFVRGVASVSAPLDYVRVARQMELLRTFPYRRFVLKNLVRQALAFAKLRPESAPYDVGRIASFRTFRQFDGGVIVPMHGFTSVDDYYRIASSGPYLPRIELPTLIVHADDDPMVPSASVRSWVERASRTVRFVPSRRGGHVAFITGLDEDAWVRTWALERVLEFFR
jgi:predicted alpha/beta-fold hydrolase